MNNTHLTIIRGCPGSGKSTYANSLGLFHVEADMYIMDSHGNYNWKPETVRASHQWCFDTVTENLKKGLAVVVSNTFTRYKEFKPYIEFCVENTIPYKVISCQNEFENIHSVPEESLKRMKERWEIYQGEEIYVIK